MKQQITKNVFKLGITFLLGLFCFVGLLSPALATTTESGLGLLEKDFTITPVNMSAEVAAQVSTDTEKGTIVVQGRLPEGETLQLSVGTEVTEKIEWRCSNSYVATIETDGKLRTLNAGEVKVTATGAKSKLKKSITITIEEIAAQNIVIATPEKTQLTVGDKMALSTTVTPATATEHKVKWQSSDTKIAYVNQQGVIQARKTGQATITAKLNDKLSDSFVLTVVPVQAIPNIQLYELNAEGEKGTPVTLNSLANPLLLEPGKEKKFWVEAVVPLNEAQDYESKVEWDCLKEDGATASKAILTKVNIKSTQDVDHDRIYHTILTVTASKKNSFAGAQVRVAAVNVQNQPALYFQVTAPKPDSMVISGAPKELEVGKTVTLKAKVKPASADQTVLWESSNPKVATIDSATGTVNVLDEGTVIFTAKTRLKDSDGTPQLTVQKELTAKWKLRSAVLNTKTIYLQPGESYDRLKAILEPSGVRTVTFSSTEPSLVTVNENGVVTAAKDAKKGKKATIRVVVGDKEKTLSCKIIIGEGKNDDPNNNPNALKEVKANTTSYKLNTGQTKKLSYKLVPSKTTQRQVRWSSADEQVATVDANGVVTAVGQSAQASTQIVGTFENGQKLTYTITIKPVMMLSADGKTYARKIQSPTLKRDEATTVYAQVRPSTDQNLSWQTSSKYIKIQDNKDGSATIKSVLPANKRSATATIRIKDSVSGKYTSFRVKLIQ